MNLVLVPNFCALLAFICAFRPLVRRAGTHTNPWFAGWIFLLLHLLLEIVSTAHREMAWLTMISRWSLELGGLCFLRAAARAPGTRRSYVLSGSMALPVMVLACLASFEVHRPVVNALICCMLLLPLGLLLRWPEERSASRMRIAKAIAWFAVCLAPIGAFDPTLALSIVHCFLFLGTAVLYWDHVPHKTSGALTATIGLVLWGITYPASLVVAREGANSPAVLAMWFLPTYLVAFGMILTLIEEHVRHTEDLAMHDALTSLPNRRLFEDRLGQAVAVAGKTGCMLACLVIDVDNFKQSNDKFGHHVGDGLLRAVATRLEWHMQPGDTLARTGGDEFAAVLPRLQSLEHLRFIVGAMMSATFAPVVVDKNVIEIGLSIGIAIHPAGEHTAESLRCAADAAMYDAKRRGGNRFAYAGGPPDEGAHLVAGLSNDLWVGTALTSR